MALCFSALTIFLYLCFLRVHSNNRIQAEPFPSWLGFELPEIDGSPVDDTCRIFETGSDMSPTISITETTTGPITRKQVVVTTKKPVVQPSPRNAVTKVLFRTRPAAGGPIPNQNTNQALRLLYYLLANSRGHLAGAQPNRGLNVMSSSEETVGVWKISAGTSEDSSEES